MTIALVFIGCFGAFVGGGVATARQAEPVPPAPIALVSPSGPAGGTWEGVNAIADNSIAMVNSSSNTLAGPYSYNSWNSYTDEWFAAS